MQVVRQGDILKLERPKTDILVLSKEFFNKCGLIIACPVVKNALPDALHIEIKSDDYTGIALIEQLKSLDIKSRHYQTISEISFEQIQNISDAVQGIFDYYPRSV